MRAKRGIVRGVALLLGGAIAVTALVGCTMRKSEDLEAQVAEDSAVSSVEEAADGGYQITLDDSVAPADFAEVAGRLGDLAESVTDDDVVLRLRAAAWQWTLAGDDGDVADLAHAVGELAGVDGILQGKVWSDDGALGIEVVAEAGIDPAAVITPLADAAASGPVDDGVRLKVFDVHERSSVETQDPAALKPALETIAVAAAVGPIQKYSLEDESLTLRMRTDEGAQAVAPVVDAMAAAGLPIDVSLSSGIMTAPQLQDDLAGRLSAILTPMEGVVGASIDTHGPKALHLSATTTDANAAATVQQALLASSDLQAFNSLQLFVLQQDEPGTRITAKTMRDEGFVGNFDRALGLAETDGVRSVALGPLELDVVLEHGADATKVAPAVKAAALRDQDAEVFGSTSWASNTDRAEFSFTVTGKLHQNLVKVSAGTADGDVQGFVDAWNNAPGL
ncbi:hypothetical protein [Leucobacter sp. USHLN154]|uniref:hypothetical protein n=1 Tax=Leucobacter sp. USHLN154 TaxID=3081269 RepID=UPI003016BA17